MTTPDDMIRVAKEVASQLLAMPLFSRLEELKQMKKTNECLHSLVVAVIRDFREF
jgi:hypothetical protein